MLKYGLKQAKKSPTWQLNLGNLQSPGKSPDFNLKIYQKKKIPRFHRNFAKTKTL